MGTFFTTAGLRPMPALFGAGRDVHDQPSARKAFLRRGVVPSQITLQRLPACVAAKQNGFWQIVV